MGILSFLFGSDGSSSGGSGSSGKYSCKNCKKHFHSARGYHVCMNPCSGYYLWKIPGSELKNDHECYTSDYFYPYCRLCDSYDGTCNYSSASSYKSKVDPSYHCSYFLPKGAIL